MFVVGLVLVVKSWVGMELGSGWGWIGSWMGERRSWGVWVGMQKVMSEVEKLLK